MLRSLLINVLIWSAAIRRLPDRFFLVARCRNGPSARICPRYASFRRSDRSLWCFANRVPDVVGQSQLWNNPSVPIVGSSIADVTATFLL